MGSLNRRLNGVHWTTPKDLTASQRRFELFSLISVIIAVPGFVVASILLIMGMGWPIACWAIYVACWAFAGLMDWL